MGRFFTVFQGGKGKVIFFFDDFASTWSGNMLDTLKYVEVEIYRHFRSFYPDCVQ